jgi:Cu+-exporting ATPase
LTLADIAVTAGGIGAILLLAWFFFGPKQARRAQISGNVQEIEITVKGGYSPDIIRVKKDIPLRLIFNRQEAGDCTSRVVFPDFRASKTLAPFAKTTLEFTPDKAGRFDFACGMNMIHGSLIVEDEKADGAQKVTAISQSRDDLPHEHSTAVGSGPVMLVAKRPGLNMFLSEVGLLARHVPSILRMR